MKKSILAIIFVISCVAFNTLLSEVSNAEKQAIGNKDSVSTVAASKCESIGGHGYAWPSACAKTHQYAGNWYGGASWRYYKLTDADKKSNNAITLSALNGTGNSIAITGCNKVGGFYLYGFEVYDARDSQPLGYNVPQVNHADMGGSVSTYKGKVKNDNTVHGAGLSAANRRHTFASITLKSDSEAKAAYQKAISQDGHSDWNGDWNTMNLSYFCSDGEDKPQDKSFSYKGSTTATANGSSQTAGPTSSQTIGKLLKVNLDSSDSAQTVNIQFTHNVTVSGNDTSKKLYWYTDTPDNKSGDQKGQLTLSDKTRNTNPINVSVTLSNGESKEACSTIYFGTKEGDSSNYAKQCVKVTVGPGLPPEEELYVTTFDADSSVKANQDICIINVDELSDLPLRTDEANCPGGSIVPSGTDITGRTLRVYIDHEGEKIALHYDHSVSRTDNCPNCDVNNLITLLPVSQGLPLSGDAAKIKDAIADKNLWGKAAKNFLSNIDSLGFDYTPFGIGHTEYYSADASVEITPTASLYCQVITYLPVRMVNEGCKSGWEKDLKDGAGLAGDAAKYVWNNTEVSDESILQTIANALGSFFQWISDNAQVIGEYIFRLFKHGVKEVKGFVNNVLQDESTGVSYACTTLQQDLNYDLVPYTSISNDVAIVGQTVSVDLGNSGVKSIPKHDGPLTATGPFRLRVATFTVPESKVYDLKGEYDKTNKTICEYYNGKGIDSGSCKEVTSAQKENLQIIPASGAYEASRTFSNLGIGAITIPVEDLATDQFVCVAAAVQDPDSDTYFKEKNQYWAISGATCRRVAKKPSLNITGGSVYSGGEIDMAMTNKNGEYYGSWVEYGAIANSKILFKDQYGFSSGRALITGKVSAINGKSKLNPLTITNPTSDPDEFGKSKIAPSSQLKDRIYKIYKEKAAQTNPLATVDLPISTCGEASNVCYYYKNGELYITASSIRGTHIIYATGDVTITSDLEYDNAPSVADIPQVVIITDGKIKIDPGVSRVDAWLVAKSVDTCTNAKLGEFAEDDCNKKLTVNGPIITDEENNNYRTNGSGTILSHTQNDKAETFNLPASAYLWSYSMSSKNSDRYYQAFVKELAPRY